MIKLTTAGESHGKGLISIIEGIPSGLPIINEYINSQLNRRRLGYGRGGRMKIEDDKAEILSGIRYGLTIGSPISFLIKNKDYPNWTDVMSADEVDAGPEQSRRVDKIVTPRPGHADLAGLLKTNQDDLRNILERSSARETAARVAGASVCRRLLEELGVIVISEVSSIGEINSKVKLNVTEAKTIDESPLRMSDKTAEKEAIMKIDEAAQNGETLGGTFTVAAHNVITGLGSYASWDERLDGKLAQAVLSIPAIKGVSFGKGFAIGKLSGSDAHDEIYYDNGYYRKTNRAGGIEGGMTNGEPVIINGVMKPIPTLGNPLLTVNMETKKEVKAFKERADVTAVPAAAVIAESMVCLVLCKAYIEKFGGDNLSDLKANISNYQKRLK